MVSILEANNITMIEEIVGLSDDDLRALDGMNEEMVVELSKIIAENVEIVEEQDEDYDEYDEDLYEDEDEEEEADESDEDAGADEPEEAESTDEPEDGAVEDEVTDATDEDEEEEEDEEVITEIDQLPGMTEAIVAKLRDAGVADLEDLINLDPGQPRRRGGTRSG